jgi:hypothetical protein
MIANAELALAFCQEVLGWEHPKAEADLLVFQTWPGQVQWGESFAYADLAQVLAASQDWCRKQHAELHFSQLLDLGDEGPSYRVIVGRPCHEFVSKSSFSTTMHVLGKSEGDDPCEVIMAACLAAHRRIMTALGLTPK